MIIFVFFSIFKHVGRFHGNGSHFEKINDTFLGDALLKLYETL
jgi:hypothetical protein